MTNDDATIVKVLPPTIRIRLQRGNSAQTEWSFVEPFLIGRDPACQVHLLDRPVSRFHAEVTVEEGEWWISDRQSANGLLIAGQQIHRQLLPAQGTLEFGLGGPVLEFVIEEKADVKEEPAHLSPAQDDPTSATQVIQRYLSPPSSVAGEHTRIYQQAFDRVTKERSKKYKKIIAVVAVLLIVAGTIAISQYLKLITIKTKSAEFFYSMKQLELQLANLEEMVMRSSNAKQAAMVVAKRQELKKMERQYDELVKELGLYEDLSEEGRAIYRVARRFGECEATMPKGFVQEVKKYITKWKSTKRLVNSLKRAKKKGYIKAVKKVMQEQNIPAQFFFLGLQESNFNTRAVGPKTRYGYAKGAWQFIPATAKEMGLRVGPQQHRPVYDPKDERFHFHKATKAAARYLKRLYTTEAQASGLLVMASYNWGQGNVRSLVRKMPENPRERNFWELLKRFKIPKETYDYVFYIIAAAVISENPKLFGFGFSNPFAASGPS